MLQHALNYHAFGWSVFPLLPRTKIPAIPSWKKYQEKRATRAEIESWWGAMPTANIALVTGLVSGIFVVDFDDMAEADKYTNAAGYCPTLCARTASGLHVYYRYPSFSQRNRVKALTGADVRGDGGFVVLPPSIHPSGKVYEWRRNPIQTAPAYLLDLLRPKPLPARPSLPPTRNAGYWARIAMDRELDTLAATMPGSKGSSGRNDQLNRSAFNLGQLVGDGLLDRGEVEAALRSTALSVGLGDGEVERTIQSGVNAGIAKPRSQRVNRW